MLDECEEESREKLLVRLKCLWNDPFIEKRVKVIITSRPHIPVTSYLPNVTQISLDASNLNKDITAFVTTEVPKLPCVSADSDLGDEIRRVLISNSDGMFLWVSLILDDLKNSTTKKRRVIREKLKALPKSLPDVYKNILRRIRGEDRRTAKTILQWIVCAIRPLTLQELTIAIAVRPEDTSIFSIWDEMQTNIQSTLQSLFGPLLRIEPGDSTVHLIHQSAKDFLSSTNLKEDNSLDREISHDGSPSGFYICPTESNLQLAIVCLNYLSFDEFEGGPLDVEYLGDLFQCHTFLKYAAIHWLQHVRQSNQENSDLWRSFWKLAQFTPRMALAYQVFCFWKNPYSYRRLHEITPLGIAAASGFTCFVKGLLDNGADVNGESGEYGSALRAAVVNGHETVVELLLSKGAEVDPDSDCLADSDSGGALYEAVSRRKTSMANKLLEAGADANGPAGFDPGTILSAAVVNKDEAMVKRLLDAGADVNDVWVEAGSVLVSAILHSSCDIVGILLKAGADVNTELDNHGPGHPDYCLGNALHAAALYGHDAVVKMLLEAKANVNALGGKYGNALTAAAAGGHEVVVKMLLGAGADANAPGGIYGSALIAAANNGHKMVVDMLLGAGADANASGPKHQSALAAAAAGGYEVVVKTLLGAGADVNAAGGIYGSALIAAANNGHEAVVDMLLGAGVDANASGPKHQNALAAAVAGGHEVVIEMLLGAGVDANTPGSSVLITAANMGHGVVVERLLKAGANVNTQEGKYGTALIAAAGQGNMKIVAMLLGAKADPNVWRLVQRNTLWDIVDSEQKQDRASKLKICTRILDRRRSSRDRSEYTKEVFAVQQQWKREAVEMLLGTGSSGTPNPTIKYQSALQAAAKGGSEEVLEKLLEAGADVNSVGGFYGSALAAAAANGRKKIVEMLLEAGADINSVGGIYGTPLQAAAANKHKDLVARLLEARADVNIRDGMYGGALVAASWTGKVKMVNMLLEAKADINIQALQAAVDGHRKNLEELLRSRINTKPKDVTDISLA
jgi:ankyrin repeat protein